MREQITWNFFLFPLQQELGRAYVSFCPHQHRCGSQSPLKIGKFAGSKRCRDCGCQHMSPSFPHAFPLPLNGILQRREEIHTEYKALSCRGFLRILFHHRLSPRLIPQDFFTFTLGSVLGFNLPSPCVPVTQLTILHRRRHHHETRSVIIIHLGSDHRHS